MKISNLVVSSVSILSFAFLIGCNSPSEKVEKAEEKVEEANNDLQKANDEYLQDIENYRIQTADKIAANEKNITEFNERIQAKKKDANEEYKTKVAELEQKNTDMKKKLADYKADGKEKWETFKSEFNHDMEALGEALKDLATNNVK